VPDIVRSSLIILFLSTLRRVAVNKVSPVFVNMLPSTSFYAVHLLNLAIFKYTCFFITAITILFIFFLNVILFAFIDVDRFLLGKYEVQWEAVTNTIMTLPVL
jgi:hypothetical protein